MPHDDKYIAYLSSHIRYAIFIHIYVYVWGRGNRGLALVLFWPSSTICPKTHSMLSRALPSSACRSRSQFCRHYNNTLIPYIIIHLLCTFPFESKFSKQNDSISNVNPREKIHFMNSELCWNDSVLEELHEAMENRYSDNRTLPSDKMSSVFRFQVFNYLIIIIIIKMAYEACHV